MTPGGDKNEGEPSMGSEGGVLTWASGECGIGGGWDCDSDTEDSGLCSNNDGGNSGLVSDRGENGCCGTGCGGDGGDNDDNDDNNDGDEDDKDERNELDGDETLLSHFLVSLYVRLEMFFGLI